MKYSIITPSYNRSNYILYCIHSVISQIYKDYEHIIIDGGSSDGTIEILKKYENIYNLKWISEPDSGMYDAINKGIKIATGDVVSILNTDDMYLPYTLHVINQNILRGYDILYGDLIVSKILNSSTKTYLQFYRKFNRRYYTHFATLAHPTIFIKKNVIEKVGLYDINYKLLGDCDYWLRCVSKNFIPQKIDDIIAIQIDHTNTLRETKPTEMKNEFKLLRTKYNVPGNYLNKKIIGKFQNVIYSRYFKIVFLLVYILRRGNKWKYFIEFIRKNEVKIDLKNSLIGLLPGFLTKNFFYSLFDVKKLLNSYIKDFNNLNL